jgi:choline-glycine betaine transporter
MHLAFILLLAALCVYPKLLILLGIILAIGLVLGAAGTSTK